MCCAGVTKGDTSITHMQLDGEPWPQIIPAGDREPLKVLLSLISHALFPAHLLQLSSILVVTYLALKIIVLFKRPVGSHLRPLVYQNPMT